MRTSLTCFFLLLFGASFGQEADSLKKVLTTTKDPETQAKLNLQIGEIYFVAKDSTCVDYFRKAVMISSQEHNLEMEMKAHYALYRYFLKNGNFDESMVEIDKAITQSRVYKDRNQEGRYLFHKARSMRKQGLAEKSIPFYQQSIELYKEINDSSRLARSLIGIGISYKRMAQYYKALDFYNQALIINTLIKDSLRMAFSLNNIGNVLKYQGNLDSAYVCYIRALHVFEQMNDTAMSCNSLNNIGLVLHRLGNTEKALSYYFKVLKLREIRGDLDGQSSVWNNVATVYRDDQKLDSAYYYMRKVLNYGIEMGLKDKQALAHHNIGTFELEQNHLESALTHLKKALSLRIELDEKWGVTSTLSTIGRVYLEQKKYGEAQKVLEQSLEFSKEIGTPDQTSDALEKLAEVYAITGNYKKAYEAQLEREVLKDTLINRERFRSINEMTGKYEHEKKQQEIEILNKENEVQALKINKGEMIRNSLLLGSLLIFILAFVLWNRARTLREVNLKLEEQKETLQQNDHEKEVLLKEIHHRVKNNLQTISSLLNMHAREMKDERVSAALIEGKNRVKSMALIHQMFYQDSEGLTEIGLHTYARELCQSVLSSYAINKENIQLEFDLDKVTINIDNGILLGLIINELVSNSVKYAFPDNRKGTINVSLKQKGSDLHLIVADNGVGKNAEHGSDSTSFGLKLVNSFMRKLKGTITVDTANGYQTTIIIPHKA